MHSDKSTFSLSPTLTLTFSITNTIAHSHPYDAHLHTLWQHTHIHKLPLYFFNSQSHFLSSLDTLPHTFNLTKPLLSLPNSISLSFSLHSPQTDPYFLLTRCKAFCHAIPVLLVPFLADWSHAKCLFSQLLGPFKKLLFLSSMVWICWPH